MSEYLVEVEHLKQYFQVRSGFKNMTLKAVDDVSFCIKPGETLGLGRRVRLRQDHRRPLPASPVRPHRRHSAL